MEHTTYTGDTYLSSSFPLSPLISSLYLLSPGEGGGKGEEGKGWRLLFSFQTGTGIWDSLFICKAVSLLGLFISCVFWEEDTEELHFLWHVDRHIACTASSLSALSPHRHCLPFTFISVFGPHSPHTPPSLLHLPPSSPPSPPLSPHLIPTTSLTYTRHATATHPTAYIHTYITIYLSFFYTTPASLTSTSLPSRGLAFGAFLSLLSSIFFFSSSPLFYRLFSSPSSHSGFFGDAGNWRNFGRQFLLLPYLRLVFSLPLSHSLWR